MADPNRSRDWYSKQEAAVEH
jgi:hypothetical protein